MILALSLATSCGIFKKSNKHIDKSAVTKIVNRDCVTVSDVQVREVDKGEVKLEKTTTVVRKSPPKKMVTEGVLKQGLNVLTDSMGRELIAVFDTLSKTVQIAISIPEVEETTTTTENTTEKKDKEKTEVKKDSAIIRDERRFEESREVVDRESKPDYTWIWCVAVVIIVVGFFVLMRIRR